MKYKYPNPLKEAPLLGIKAQWTAPWMLFFQHSLDKSEVLDSFYVISEVSASGTNYVVDRWPKSDGKFVWLIFFIENGLNIKSGMIMASWNTDGTLVARHTQYDVMDIGDTSDQRFSFNYDSTLEQIQFRSSSTNTYLVSLLRIVLK